MTSKNLFFKLMLENMKRRIWTLALGFLVFFFTLPVAEAFVFSDKRYYTYENYENYRRMIDENALDIISAGNGFLVIVVVTAALICGVSSFAYLHSKKKVDFYHSLPVRRETLFAVSFVNGILIMAAVYLVNLLIAMAVMAANGMSPGMFVGAGFKAFGFHMVYYLLMYATTVLAMMLTGNVILGILMNVILNAWGPLAILLASSCFASFFRTYYYASENALENAIQYASPLALYIKGMAETGKRVPQLAPEVIPAFVLAAVITLAALFLYKVRPSEAAGKALAFKVSQAPIKVLLVVPISIAYGRVFRVWGDGDGWMVFGILCGLVIFHAIIEIVYHFEFRKLFAHPVHLGVCAVLSAAIVCVFRFDLAGYDSYLPDAGNVESAAVEIVTLNSWIDYRVPKFVENRYGRQSGIEYEYVNDAEHIFENMKITDVEPVLELARRGIERNDSLTETDYDGVQVLEAGSAEDADSTMNTINIHYNLKNGKTVNRSYYLSLGENRELIDQICSDIEYKKGSFPVLTEWADQISGFNYITPGSDFVQVNGAVTGELLAAYQEEFSALTNETMRAEAPVGLLTVKTKEVQEISDRMKRENGNTEWTDLNYLYRYPVYPSFKKTLSLLEKGGVSTGLGFETEDIAYVRVGDPYGAEYYSEEELEHMKPFTVKITDRGEIGELLDLAIYGEYESFDRLFFGGNKGVELYVELGPADGETETGYSAASYSFTIPEDKLPGYVKDVIEIGERNGYRQGF